eukprot:TRINITY_DN21515_c0_g1_i1.p1 TRINITY_DN21515_c0_g1~~TRINITY_DN21515_c0_g1_i1.p1  ORF type:complete len:674 (-),score=128.07 TRINITY_DN21515_c0_g1_i1:3-2024(-)
MEQGQVKLFEGLDVQPIIAKLSSGKSNGGIHTRNRKHVLRSYKDCFTGALLVSWVTHEKPEWTPQLVLQFGQYLLNEGIIASPISPGQPFKHDESLYSFQNMSAFKRGSTLTRTREEIVALHEVNSVSALMQDPARGLEISDRKWKGKHYSACFVANEAVTWLVQNLNLQNRAEAVVWGEHLQQMGLIRHVNSDVRFQDRSLLFHVNGNGDNTATPTNWKDDLSTTSEWGGSFEESTEISIGHRKAMERATTKNFESVFTDPAVREKFVAFLGGVPNGVDSLEFLSNVDNFRDTAFKNDELMKERAISIANHFLGYGTQPATIPPTLQDNLLLEKLRKGEFDSNVFDDLFNAVKSYLRPFFLQLSKTSSSQDSFTPVSLPSHHRLMSNDSSISSSRKFQKSNSRTLKSGGFLPIQEDSSIAHKDPFVAKLFAHHNLVDFQSFLITRNPIFLNYLQFVVESSSKNSTLLRPDFENMAPSIFKIYLSINKDGSFGTPTDPSSQPDITFQQYETHYNQCKQKLTQEFENYMLLEELRGLSSNTKQNAQFHQYLIQLGREAIYEFWIEITKFHQEIYTSSSNCSDKLVALDEKYFSKDGKGSLGWRADVSLLKSRLKEKKGRSLEAFQEVLADATWNLLVLFNDFKNKEKEEEEAKANKERKAKRQISTIRSRITLK